VSVKFEDIAQARARIDAWIHRTPVLRCAQLDELSGAQLRFKCENFQKIGAFKFRGASNAILMLSEAQAARGVVTESSGNHGAAVALAARRRGIPAAVVMAESSLELKRRIVASHGALVVLCSSQPGARSARTRELAAERGAAIVHPFNDPAVIAGQGTAAVELFEEEPELDALIVPVGGGGLISGCAIAASELSPRTRVIGAEPALADDAQRSLAAGHLLPGAPPRSIADGLLTGLGELTFEVIRRHVQAILTASEAQIIEAMRLIWTRMKIVVEPSSAVPLAVLLAHAEQFRGQRVGLLVSGGNVDLDALPWLAPHPS
jgi:threonine dehydratase